MINGLWVTCCNLFVVAAACCVYIVFCCFLWLLCFSVVFGVIVVTWLFWVGICL